MPSCIYLACKVGRSAQRWLAAVLHTLSTCRKLACSIQQLCVSYEGLYAVLSQYEQESTALECLSILQAACLHNPLYSCWISSIKTCFNGMLARSVIGQTQLQ
jgi:hypothetical protein